MAMVGGAGASMSSKAQTMRGHGSHRWPRPLGVRPFLRARRLASVPAVLRIVRQEPSAVLFMAQLLAILVYPAMESTDTGRALFSAFGIAILGLVVRAVRS